MLNAACIRLSMEHLLAENGFKKITNSNKFQAKQILKSCYIFAFSSPKPDHVVRLFKTIASSHDRQYTTYQPMALYVLVPSLIYYARPEVYSSIIHTHTHTLLSHYHITLSRYYITSKLALLINIRGLRRAV